MSDEHMPSIFYDPQRRRWRRFTRTVQCIAAVGSCIVAVLLASVLINPVLPSLGIGTCPCLAAWASPHSARRRNPFPTTRSSDFNGPSGNCLGQAESRGTKHETHQKSAQARLPVTSSESSAPHGPSEFIGYYVNWDDTSFTSLKQNLAHLDKLMPEWLHLASADGTLAIDDPHNRHRC